MFNFKEIGSHELKDWMDQEHDFKLLDIRSESEIRQGKIPACEAIPMHQVPNALNQLSPSDRFVVYCRSGVRSAQVCGFLQQQGYKEVYNLKGGIIDWYQNGHPIVTE